MTNPDVIEALKALEEVKANVFMTPYYQQRMEIVAARLAALSTPAKGDDVIDGRNKLTAEYLAMTPLQKWDTLTVHGLLGTDEPWIADMRETLTALTDSAPTPHEAVELLREVATNAILDRDLQERIDTLLSGEPK